MTTHKVKPKMRIWEEKDVLSKTMVDIAGKRGRSSEMKQDRRRQVKV